MDIEEDIDDPMEIDDTIQTSQIIENKSFSSELSFTDKPPEETDANNISTVTTEVSENKQNSEDQTVDNKTEQKIDAIVVLDDDEEPSAEKEKLKAKTANLEVKEVIDLVPHATKCINYECKSGKQLMAAPGFCLSYYRVKSSTKKKQEVCSSCYDEAVLIYDKLVEELKQGKSIFSVKTPMRDDLFEIEDSDEEDNNDLEATYVTEKSSTFIKNNIDNVLNNLLCHFNLEEIANKEVVTFNERMSNIQEQCKELNEELKRVRTNVDKMQLNFYNEFKPVIRELNPVSIIDDHTYNPNTVIRPEFLPNPGRRGVRKGVKTINYAEMDGSSNSPKPITADSSKPVEKEVKKAVVEQIAANEPHNLPPVGSVEKPPLKIGEIYYISRDNASGSWIRGRLTSIILPGTMYNGQKSATTLYKFTELKQLKERVVSGKNVAYNESAKVRLEVGARVVAVFKETVSTGEMKNRRTNVYYPGVVAEPPYEQNNYRYLIFFDVGYSQYVEYSMVNLVYEVSKNVWEDMPIDCRNFIKKHIESQDWPMVKLTKNQNIITEYNGKWLPCTVINVDCSLVHVFFEDLNRFEWIYRGSRRIKEIFREEQAAASRAGQRTSSRKVNESGTIVQYTPNVNYNQSNATKEKEAEIVESQPNISQTTGVRAVARKSTNKPQKTTPAVVPFLPPLNNLLNATGPTSKIMYFTPRDQLTMRRPYRAHECSNACKDYVTHSFAKLRGQNPLSKPLLCGWARMTIKVRGRKDIMYKAPCGRLLRNIAEVHYYLHLTDSDMTVDLFDFNHMVRCLAEFSVDCEPDPKDLSKSLEQVPIPVINGINNEMLDFCNYSTKRVPMEGVNMNLDPDFLVSCDCEDDCIDKTKCSCWKLTLEGAKFFDPNVDPNSVGYIYRRLPEQVVTGIYECNDGCKCKKTCLNRVAQNSMSLKLQVFRTHNRGWGIRCLNDVPQGTFICIYAGTIHTDQRANEDGKTYGDEYFAELDYIESVETYKEEYEEDKDEEEEDEEEGRKRAPSPMDDETDLESQLRNGAGGKKAKGYMDDNDFVANIAVPISERETRMQTRQRRKNPVTPNQTSKDKKEEAPKKEVVPKKEEAAKKEEASKEEASKKDEAVKIKEEPKTDISNLSSAIDTVTISDDEDEVPEILSFNPKNAEDLDEKATLMPSVRQMYGRDESIYIMDAKNAGNIGRFLNHSCSPNVFVQNVFVDTHDPRFPWVAFFSSQFIRAGTELTWNYSYDIGSVPGKVLYCHCASLECKGRLL